MIGLQISIGPRLKGLLRRRSAEIEPSDVVEPCAACGDETAVGSWLYPGRHTLVNAAGRAFLCDECYAKSRHEGHEPHLDQDMRVIAGNGAMIGVGFLGPR